MEGLKPDPKTIAEFSVKRNLKTDAFLLRRLRGVGAEAFLLATYFNLVRVVSILGVSCLIGKLSALSP